ncbi:4-phosphoerythronate dehydrogenase [Psychromonas antarctica]|uniref:4-phosphoerythronate dehydrogenase n=1 Tax=Psychromonas antarctica TaxID=67573 RepID=UPI001EE8DD93|nr:4-phosphoerythronate dehydrogenase [Psychromonas antarctica]MCG6200584.1 4-phosphoerythronate dehydrogenase [Psychromonas antarctica]
MNIYIDENIPYAKEFFTELGQLHFFSGRGVTAEQLQDADILLVRSITQVNEQLLYLNNSLKFVGTATIGTDHIDTAYLKSRAVKFSSAPGCNKISVGEYILSSLLVLAEQQQFELTDKKVAIVGAGNTGTAVADLLLALGVSYLLYDPPLQLAGDKREFCSFAEVLSADIISLHVPKTAVGPFPTVHLFDEAVLRKLNNKQILMNASRGEVIDNQALLKLAQQGMMPTLVLDVWENEPNINKDLLPFVDIATPHIAGYSLDGKVRGTEMLYHALSTFLMRKPKLSANEFVALPAINAVSISQKLDQSLLKSLMHLIFDVRRDDALFRQIIDSVDGFDTMRKTYHERRELSTLTIHSSVKQNRLLQSLGFSTNELNNIKDQHEI